MSNFSSAALAALFSMSALAMSVPAQAAGAPDPAATAPAANSPLASKDPDRIICKREETVGTRLGGKKECHTAAQWDDISHESAAALTALQTANIHANPGGH